MPSVLERRALSARLVAVVLGTAVAVLAAFACLPDLSVAPTNVPCGNGVVELDAEACDPGDAGTLGCSAKCAVECEGGVVDPKTNHCYFWTTSVISFDDGEHACEQSGAHMVSFVDDDEWTFVSQSAVPLTAGGSTWLALQKGSGVNEAGITTYFSPLGFPGWSASCPGCYALADGGDADIPLPTSGKAQVCVNWKRTLTSTWVQAACSLGTTDAGVQNTAAVLCEREPPGAFAAPCPGDASADLCIEVPTTRGKKRYELVTAALDFDNARAGCESRGGTLVHFESSAEREEVVDAIAAFIKTNPVWIGLYWDTTASAWKWTDGTNAPTAFPTPWGDLEPIVMDQAAAIRVDVTFDTRLAHVIDTTTVAASICQLAD